MKVFAGKYIRMRKKKIDGIAKDSESNLAVVIDLDETVLDNSQYQVEGQEVACVLLRNLGQNGYNEERRVLFQAPRVF